MLLLLSRFSRVQLCVTPETAAQQAPLYLGFSRQEHRSGVPFPSPMHESEKLTVKSLSCVRLLATPWTVAHQAPPSMRFSRQEYWVPAPSPLIMRTCKITKSYTHILDQYSKETAEFTKKENLVFYLLKYQVSSSGRVEVVQESISDKVRCKSDM